MGKRFVCMFGVQDFRRVLALAAVPNSEFWFS